MLLFPALSPPVPDHSPVRHCTPGPLQTLRTVLSAPAPPLHTRSSLTLWRCPGGPCVPLTRELQGKVSPKEPSGHRQRTRLGGPTMSPGQGWGQACPVLALASPEPSGAGSSPAVVWFALVAVGRGAHSPGLGWVGWAKMVALGVRGHCSLLCPHGGPLLVAGAARLARRRPVAPEPWSPQGPGSALCVVCFSAPCSRPDGLLRCLFLSPLPPDHLERVTKQSAL